MLPSRILAGGWPRINTSANMITKDKRGNNVAVGNVVKLGRKKDRYRIIKIIQVDSGVEGETYPIFELLSLEPQTIFRGEHQIELSY
jgi:hypothetical protein